MGSTTIGTNVVTDGSTEYEVLKSLLEGIGKIFDRKKDSEYAKNLKSLAQHLNKGGTLNYKLVENKYVGELKKALGDAEIPFILMPNDRGETAIATRDSDRAVFLEIQDRIFSKYTDYWKERAAEKLVDNIWNDPEFKKSKVPVLSFAEKEMRLIASQKLFDNGVVTGYDPTRGITIVHPDSVYRDGMNGGHGDLVDAQLDMAFEQAKGDGFVKYDLLSVRKAQAVYDKDTLMDFCRAFKEGKSMSLWDATGQSKAGLSINRNGDIELCTPGSGYAGFSGEESIRREICVRHGDTISETELFAMLSRHAGKIHNMVTCSTFERNKILAGERGVVKCDRPQFLENSPERCIHQDLSRGFEAALNEVKAAAVSRVEEAARGKRTSMEKKAQMKEDAVIEILKNRSHPALQLWLSGEVKSRTSETILTRADKETFLDKVLEHFADNHESSRDEMRVDKISVKELRAAVREAAARDHDKDADRTSEAEQEKA